MVALAWLYGPSAPMPAFIPISWRIGPVDDRHGRHRAGAAAARGHAGRGQGQDHREVLGARAGHDRVHRDLLDRVLPVLAEVGGPHAPDDLVGPCAACAPAWPPPAPRSAARSAACPSSGCRGTAGAGCPRCRARRGAASSGRTRPAPSSSSANGRVSPSTTSCMTGRPVIGSRAVDVGAQLGRRLAHDRLRDEHLAQPRHAVDLGHRADDPVELVGVDGHGGDPVLRSRSSSRARRPPARRCFSGRRRGWRRGRCALISSQVVGSSCR